MTELFYRHGEAFQGKALDPDGKPHIVRTRICSRCGGAGGADKWAHTGWTCFDCGGSGKRGTETVRLYTAERLAKLNEIAAKKAAKKQAAFEAAEAVRKAETDARRAAFEAEHGILISVAKNYRERSSFIADVVAKAEERATLTEAQAEALRNAVAKLRSQDAAKAMSRWVGKIGERIETEVTAERLVTVATQFGLLYILTMRDGVGNALVSKGRFRPEGATFNRETERWSLPTEAFVIRGTVKEHNVYRDEQQTVLSRVAERVRKEAA